MYDNANNLYWPGMGPKDLADSVIRNYFGDQIPSIPIDPFKLMRDYGIVYQFMGFDKLEGIYILPNNEKDIPVVGINYKRPITRQRFTAAHELCHHIKDRRTEVCRMNSDDQVEKFAENFAAELLMPEGIFLDVVAEYTKNGLVSLDDALLISERFGVSFTSCVHRLAYRFKLLEGDYSDLKKRIQKYKPDQKKTALGIDTENINLLIQIVDSYPYSFSMEDDIVWFRFKEDFIYNENRIEGLNLDQDEVFGIVTDLRTHKQDSKYCGETYEEFIQVTGHSSIYDYIFDTNEDLSIDKLLSLNEMLYQFAPFPEGAGTIRTSNALVCGSKFETVDCFDIMDELFKLQEPVNDLVQNASGMTVSEYILHAVKIHHRITQIHPFQDGNGRCSRALLNWMLRIKGLPPFYIKTDEKDKYYTALEWADSEGNYIGLFKVIIQEMFRTMIRLGKKSPWNYII